LVGLVQEGAMTTAVASEFLELLDLPPTPRTLAKLEALTKSHPEIDDFREAYAWRLLRAGKGDEAFKLFSELGERSDLPDDLKSSALLAFGCLASRQSIASKTPKKLRATVEAAPANLQSTRPLPPSDSAIRKAVPVDMRPSQSTLVAARVCSAIEETTPSRRGSAGAAVFTGDLRAFCLPDLLEFLRSGQRTGTLVCSSVAGIGAIQLRLGRITGAAAPQSKGLRHHLIQLGAATEEHLSSISSEPPPSAGDHAPLIGTFLVRSGIVSHDQLCAALRRQIQDAIAELVRWSEGQFAFENESLNSPSNQDVEVELDPQAILLELFRLQDEQSRFQ
jgi:hypothetical protein